MRYLFVLGASDPEMAEIETVVKTLGHAVAYASISGARVHPGIAYRATDDITVPKDCAAVVRVECGGDAIVHHPVINEGETDCVGLALNSPAHKVVDHHNPGDPGFGRDPAEFFEASSLGQVINLLQIRGTARHRMIAAADHCLGAAYAGRCPGVDPADLAEFRNVERAAFRKVAVEVVKTEIEAAMDEIQKADKIDLGGTIAADMRRPAPIPELPEAATRLGIDYVSGPLIGPDGRRKYTVSGESAARAFLDGWGEANGLIDLYGDPKRGFAGGYAKGDA